MLAPDAQRLDYALIIRSPLTSWQSGNHVSFQVQLETFGYSAVRLCEGVRFLITNTSHCFTIRYGLHTTRWKCITGWQRNSHFLCFLYFLCNSESESDGVWLQKGAVSQFPLHPAQSTRPALHMSWCRISCLNMAPLLLWITSESSKMFDSMSPLISLRHTHTPLCKQTRQKTHEAADRLETSPSAVHGKG